MNREELILYREHEENIRILLAEDKIIPKRSDLILDDQLDQKFAHERIIMVEPKNHDDDIGRGIVIERVLRMLGKWYL